MSCLSALFINSLVLADLFRFLIFFITLYKPINLNLVVQIVSVLRLSLVIWCCRTTVFSHPIRFRLIKFFTVFNLLKSIKITTLTRMMLLKSNSVITSIPLTDLFLVSIRYNHTDVCSIPFFHLRQRKWV